MPYIECSDFFDNFNNVQILIRFLRHSSEIIWIWSEYFIHTIKSSKAFVERADKTWLWYEAKTIPLIKKPTSSLVKKAS